MNGFAGNMLALRSTRRRRADRACPTRPGSALAPETRRRLERFGGIVTAPIPTIERLGGGSVRCMIAEVFLPRSAGGGR